MLLLRERNLHLESVYLSEKQSVRARTESVTLLDVYDEWNRKSGFILVTHSEHITYRADHRFPVAFML